MQERYWNFMTQCKYVLIYYGMYFRRSVKLDRTVKIILATISTLCLGGWIITDSSTKFWSIFIVVAQILIAVNEFLPYRRRVEDLNEIRIRLLAVYENIEHNWYKVSNGSITEEEINDLLSELKKQWDEIECKYFQKDALPRRKRLLKKAEDERTLYFSNIFN